MIQTLLEGRPCPAGMCSPSKEKLEFQGSHTEGNHGYGDKFPHPGSSKGRGNIRATPEEGGSPSVGRQSLHPKVPRGGRLPLGQGHFFSYTPQKAHGGQLLLLSFPTGRMPGTRKPGKCALPSIHPRRMDPQQSTHNPLLQGVPVPTAAST